jgi:GT2 family glycosyltransferase
LAAARYRQKAEKGEQHGRPHPRRAHGHEDTFHERWERMSDKPLVSVIVLFDRGEFEPCLSSLLAQEGVEFEIMAVVSDEPSVKKIESTERVRPLAIKERNPAFRRNSAAARANGKYLAFIDDDATAPPEWLKKGVGYLEINSVYAGVGGPNLCPEDSSFREKVTDRVLTTPLIGAGSRAYRGGGRTSPAKPGEVHLVNFIVRRDWFDRVNGLNEEMGYGGEDTEFLHMLGRLGGKVMFLPMLVVYHRRRPFGFAYFKQRFWLRRQSARLFITYPGIYLRNLSFIGAILILPVILFLVAYNPLLRTGYGLLILLLCYLAIVWLIFSLYWSNKFSVWRKDQGWFIDDYSWVILESTILHAALIGLIFHHIVNLAGFWFGLLEALFTGPWRVRRKIKRGIDSCDI